MPECPTYAEVRRRSSRFRGGLTIAGVRRETARPLREVTLPLVPAGRADRAVAADAFAKAGVVLGRIVNLFGANRHAMVLVLGVGATGRHLETIIA